jgi:hypothetical protein
MSGQLIGQVIGSFFGPWGAMIGGMIGGMLDPAKGPSLGDIKPQSSEYGRPLPVIYGTIALGGNVIWASEFRIVAGEGGKGGETPTGDTAYGDFAVAICEGGDDIFLGRIWAGPERRLIWDGATLEGDATLRFYNGSQTQLPDPLIEAAEGVGNVEAYRGVAYVVIENFPLVKDGNRLPFLTIEVGHLEVNTAPEDLGVFFLQQVIVTEEFYAVIYHGSYFGIIVRRLSDNSLVKHITYDLLEFPLGQRWFWDEDRQVFVRPNINALTLSYATIPLTTGLPTQHTITAAPGAEANPGLTLKSGVYHNGYYVFAAAGSASTRTTMYLMNPDSHEPVFTYTSDMNGDFVGPLLKPIDSAARVYGMSAPQTLKKYGLAAAFTPIDMGQPAAISAQFVAEVDPHTGLVWTVSAAGGNTTVHVNDPTTNTLVYSTTVVGFATLANQQPLTFVPALGADPNRAFVTGVQWLGIDRFLAFNATTPALLSDTQGGYHGTAAIQAMVYNPVTDSLMAFRNNAEITFGSRGDPTTTNFLGENFLPELDNFYLGARDATVRPGGQPLDEVVLDLSLRAGLTAAQVDVTQLADDMVDGYAIATPSTVRDAITALMPAYFFDAVESEGKVKFVKRGGAVTRVIANEDVGCFEAGADPVDPIETTRRMEDELPRALTVKYILEATDYAVASKLARRLIGSSGAEDILDFPLVMTDQKGQEVAEANLHGRWVARITYSFTLTRKHADLEPTDVITVYGYTMRLTKTINVDGVIKCEAEADAMSTWTPRVVVDETLPGEGGSGGGVVTTSTTILELA